MAEKTDIQWCDSTVNPTMGCDGCELWSADAQGRRSCYAGTEHVRKGPTNTGFSPEFNILTRYPGRTAEAANWPSLKGHLRDDEPWKKDLPRMIFVSDMSDALSKEISFGYLMTQVIDVADSKAGRRHIWQWLTKQPQRMAQFAEWLKERGVSWPANLWAGTTITSSGTMGRINGLVKVPARVRFLSVEPQLDDIDLTGRLEGIHWVIQGGESGYGKDPVVDKPRDFHVEWADTMRNQCHDAGVAYFLKQLGKFAFENNKPIKLKHPHGSNWNEWDQRLRVREFPIK